MDKLTQLSFKSCGAINTTPAGKPIYLFLSELTFWESDGVIISQRVFANWLRLSKSAIRRNQHRLAELGVRMRLNCRKRFKNSTQLQKRTFQK